MEGEVDKDVANENEQKDRIKSEFLGVFGQTLIKELKSNNDPSDVSNANWYEDGINSFKNLTEGWISR